MEIQKYTRISLLLALSVVLNIVESFFPFFSGNIPGLKLGLANAIVLLVIYVYGFKEAITIAILRVFLVGILRTGLFNISFFFSLSGSILSALMMYVAYKYVKFSIIGVSVVGAISHSIGQILVAMVMLNNVNIVYYLPLMLISSLITGIIIGIISKGLVKIFKKRLQNT